MKKSQFMNAQYAISMPLTQTDMLKLYKAVTKLLLSSLQRQRSIGVFMLYYHLPPYSESVEPLSKLIWLPKSASKIFIELGGITLECQANKCTTLLWMLWYLQALLDRHEIRRTPDKFRYAFLRAFVNEYALRYNVLNYNKDYVTICSISAVVILWVLAIVGIMIMLNAWVIIWIVIEILLIQILIVLWLYKKIK